MPLTSWPPILARGLNRSAYSARCAAVMLCASHGRAGCAAEHPFQAEAPIEHDLQFGIDVTMEHRDDLPV